jgi:CelD/BcsL family acetyltransferase involved in cellulose biosynthesis
MDADHAGMALSQPLTLQIVSRIEAIHALGCEYARLYRITGNCLPFARQEWHLSWCEHFLNRNPRIRDEPRFCVLRTSGGECVALVPLILSRRRVGPVRLGTVDLVGSDPGLTEIRGPLVERGYERQTIAAVHESLSELPDWDWILWSGVSAELAQALASEVAPEWNELSHDYVLDLPRSWEAFRGTLKRNIRESLRHCYNSLKRDALVFELQIARTPAQLGPALARFFELHTLRARMSSGPRHPDRFADPLRRAFLSDVCQRLAAQDGVRIFQLIIKGEIVATRIGFLTGDSLYLYYSGFDPAWARYSVMTTVVAEALRYAIGCGLRSVNLSLNPEQSKLRWRPRLVLLHSAFVSRDSLRSRLACRAYRRVFFSNASSARLVQSVFASRRRWN